MKGFKNIKIYVEGKGIVVTSLAVDNGKIVNIGDDLEVEEYCPSIEGYLVVPGFIDQHIHGANGADAMDGDIKKVNQLAVAVAQEGTTSFLPTTMTQSPENIIKALTAINEYMHSNPSTGAKVLGVHLEGPYISTDFIGAQPLEYVQKPTVESFKRYQEASGDNIRIVSLAPEVEGSDELIKYLVDNNILVSIGHTSAKYNDVEKAVLGGARNVTHTYNAQKPLHHREIGTVGSALLIDDLNCELICDTIHVSVPAIRLVIKSKPADKVTLITDSLEAKYLPDGNYELGGQAVVVINGEARLHNGTLAGSVLRMNVAVKNVHQLAGIELTKVLDMASINPAKNIGVDKERGSIKVGKYADFVVLDENFDVVMTISEGRVIYQR
ncbi:MAG: N-acetylglucosamine-6-phosphate deacetylase [Bacilli bacterium]|nr:N-acetylglucosamine-6-phosphate deacetylase [Bacilli bacterium]